MLNIVLTIVPILLLIGVVLISVKYKNKESSSFLDLNQTSLLKAISCIIIIYVHIPQAFSNSLQDLIGSFAGVGVLLFFLFSSFGTLTHYEKSKNGAFFATFWIKRISNLFITALIINMINLLWCGTDGTGWSILNLVNFNKYIYAILVGYLIIFIFLLVDYLTKSKKTIFIYSILGCVLFVSSLITFFTKFKMFQIWSVESVGLTIGVVLFCLREYIESILNKTKPYIITIFVVCMVAGISSLIYLLKKDDSFLVGFLLRAVMYCSIGAFLIVLTHKIDVSRKPIHVLGSASYGVYLLHLVVIKKFALWFPQNQSGLFILAIVVSSVAGAVLINLCVKPINKAIRAGCKRIEKALLSENSAEK